MTGQALICSSIKNKQFPLKSPPSPLLWQITPTLLKFSSTVDNQLQKSGSHVTRSPKLAKWNISKFFSFCSRHHIHHNLWEPMYGCMQWDDLTSHDLVHFTRPHHANIMTFHVNITITITITITIVIKVMTTSSTTTSRQHHDISCQHHHHHHHHHHYRHQSHDHIINNHITPTSWHRHKLIIIITFHHHKSSARMGHNRTVRALGIQGVWILPKHQQYQ